MRDDVFKRVSPTMNMPGIFRHQKLWRWTFLALAVSLIVCFGILWNFYQKVADSARRSCIESMAEALAQQLKADPVLQQRVSLQSEWTIMDDENKKMLLESVAKSEALDCHGISFLDSQTLLRRTIMTRSDADDILVVIEDD